MDLTPKSLGAPSPGFSSTVRGTTTKTPNYPTTPQSRAETEVLSAHSSLISGLGIMNSDFQTPIPHLPIYNAQQPHLHSPQSWRDGCISAQNYLTPPSTMAAFSGVTAYEDLEPISATTNSPFVVPGVQPVTQNQVLLLGPSHQRRNEDVLFGRVSAAVRDSDLYYGQLISPRTLPREKVGLRKDWEVLQVPDNVKKGFTGEEVLLYQQHEMCSSVAGELGEDSGNMLLELDHNVERTRIISRAPRTPHSNAPANTVNSIRVQTGGVRKASRRPNSAVAKYECETCGMHFTRSSNCKSHMKIHDPDREFPHSCAEAACNKKFSRKTDLARHVESVHMKIRKFGCQQCGHRFARQDTLRRHCEDGCKKLYRQSQRSLANATSPLTPNVPCSSAPRIGGQRDVSGQEPDEHQIPHTSFSQSPFLDRNPNTYPQFL